jgi:hypothetical protein
VLKTFTGGAERPLSIGPAGEREDLVGPDRSTDSNAETEALEAPLPEVADQLKIQRLLLQLHSRRLWDCGDVLERELILVGVPFAVLHPPHEKALRHLHHPAAREVLLTDGCLEPTRWLHAAGRQYREEKKCDRCSLRHKPPLAEGTPGPPTERHELSA